MTDYCSTCNKHWTVIKLHKCYRDLQVQARIQEALDEQAERQRIIDQRKKAVDAAVGKERAKAKAVQDALKRDIAEIKETLKIVATTTDIVETQQRIFHDETKAAQKEQLVILESIEEQTKRANEMLEMVVGKFDYIYNLMTLAINDAKERGVQLTPQCLEQFETDAIGPEHRETFKLLSGRLEISYRTPTAKAIASPILDEKRSRFVALLIGAGLVE